MREGATAQPHAAGRGLLRRAAALTTALATAAMSVLALGVGRAWGVAGETVLVSAGAGGTAADSASSRSAASDDGRHVAFRSYASNLVAGDTNGTWDVFVRDTVTGTTARVSVGAGGVEANGSSDGVAISGDGRYVAFSSYASNLAPGDTNGKVDIFVRDTVAGVTSRVSVATDGTQGNQDSSSPALSRDGRYVVFSSNASNLVWGDTGWQDVFVRDTAAGVTTRVSVAWTGTTASGPSYAGAVSDDGRYVAFSSYAWNLEFGDTNGKIDVFVRDTAAGVTTRVSEATDGTQGNDDSYRPDVSGDGRHVVFYSAASNLVAGDTNAALDVFVRDTTTGVTSRASVASDGSQANGRSDYPAISGGGRYVAFTSQASNLVAGDTNAKTDAFVRDVVAGVTARVSVATDGTQADDDSYEPSVSTDGAHVAFASSATNLVVGDTNATEDVFVHDTGAAENLAPVAVLSARPDPTRDFGVLLDASGSGDGDGTVTDYDWDFGDSSTASGPDPDVSHVYAAPGAYAVTVTVTDDDGAADTVSAQVEAVGAEDPATSRVSVSSGGTQGNVASYASAVSWDGRYVAFASGASNLVAGDTNGAQDVFVRDTTTGVTTRVSVATGATESNGASDVPAVSWDGRYVVFHSDATNLVAGDTNGKTDVFVHDRDTGATSRVSVAGDATQGDSWSYSGALSEDGRHVVFYSAASNLVAGDTNGYQDVFVHDRDTGVTSRASVATDGTEGDSNSYSPVVSGDGRYVAFSSEAMNFLADDVNWDSSDVFVHDRVTGVTSLVSVASDGTQGDGSSDRSSITRDGRHVAFHSYASNLVPGDANGESDVFVHDTTTGTTTRVSVPSGGGEAGGSSSDPVISGAGRYVAFSSNASNLVAGDTNGQRDVFLHDRDTGVTTRVSQGSFGAQGDAMSYWAAMSANGRHVAFTSQATNLVTGDTNSVQDVFVHDTRTAENQAPTAAFSTAPNPLQNLGVLLDASGSDDVDGTITDYHWDFGDTTTTGGPDPAVVHTYPAPGVYTVTLTVTDDDAATTTAQVEVAARPVAPPGTAPGAPAAAPQPPPRRVAPRRCPSGRKGRRRTRCRSRARRARSSRRSRCRADSRARRRCPARRRR